MQFTKLMWMKDHRPEEYARIYKVLGVKEYIVQRLTGRFGENDFSDVPMQPA
ncbi:MAG: FGGY family carbohydrate kinase [Oscillospiraceae bacterium]